MGLKTVEEIYQALLEDFSKRIGRDVSHSCDLAVRLYAVAAQVQALYVQMDWVQRQSFPQTARGVYLDYHAQTPGAGTPCCSKSYRYDALFRAYRAAGGSCHSGRNRMSQRCGGAL